MTISLYPQGFEDLEKISHDFLWGKNELGEFRKPLVAWKFTALNQAEGGVGFEDFQSTTLALKMRLCSRLLTEEDTTWVLLARANIARSLDSGFQRRTRRYWMEMEAFLLDENFAISGSLLLHDLLHGFNKVRKHLIFVTDDATLPGSLSIE